MSKVLLRLVLLLNLFVLLRELVFALGVAWLVHAVSGPFPLLDLGVPLLGGSLLILTIWQLARPSKLPLIAITALSIPLYVFFGSYYVPRFFGKREGEKLFRQYLESRDPEQSKALYDKLLLLPLDYGCPIAVKLHEALPSVQDSDKKLQIVNYMGRPACGNYNDKVMGATLVDIIKRTRGDPAQSALHEAAWTSLEVVNRDALRVDNAAFVRLERNGTLTFTTPASVYGSSFAVALHDVLLPDADSADSCERSVASKLGPYLKDLLRDEVVGVWDIKRSGPGRYKASILVVGNRLDLRQRLPLDSQAPPDWCGRDRAW